MEATEAESELEESYDQVNIDTKEAEAPLSFVNIQDGGR